MNLGGLKLPPIDHQGSKAQQEGQKRPKTHQKQPKMPHTKLLQHAIETHKGGEIIFEHPFFSSIPIQPKLLHITTNHSNHAIDPITHKLGLIGNFWAALLHPT